MPSARGWTGPSVGDVFCEAAQRSFQAPPIRPSKVFLEVAANNFFGRIYRDARRHDFYCPDGRNVFGKDAVKKNKTFPGIFLSVVPLLFQALDWRQAFFLGGWITFAFWATGFFFATTRSFFPARVAIIAPLLWIVTLAQCGRYLGINPAWVLSLFLLLPFSFVTQPPKRFPKEPMDFFWIRRGLAFWALLLYLGIFQDGLGKKFGLLIFREPAGSWILLGLALVVAPGLSGPADRAPEEVRQ